MKSSLFSIACTFAIFVISCLNVMCCYGEGVGNSVAVRRAHVGLPRDLTPSDIVRTVENNRSMCISEKSLARVQQPPYEMGQQFRIGGEPFLLPDNGQTPSVAFDGHEFLVVWDGVYPNEIMCARVDTTGWVIDSLGIPLPTVSYPGSVEFKDPAVAFDGVNFLVIWQAKCPTWAMFDIDGARISPSGGVLDPNGLKVVPGGYSHPDIAFDGQRFLVVWEQLSYYNQDIYGAFVDTSGVSQGASFPICTSSVDKYSPAVAFNGTNYLVVFEKTSGIYGTRVSKAGVILDASPIAICDAPGFQVSPAVTSAGSQYFVAWQDWRSGTPSKIYFSRVSGDGVIQDQGGKPISSSSGCQMMPVVGFDGSDFVVVWADSSSGPVPPDLRMARITTAGSVLDPFGVAIGAPGSSRVRPSIAVGTTKGLVAWEDSSQACIHGVRAVGLNLPDLMAEHEPTQVSHVLNSQANPSVAFDGLNYFGVWEDSRGVCGSAIYGSRIDAAGTVLDPGGIKISSGDVDRRRPAVAFDGANYLVVWEESQGNTASIACTRVSKSGRVLDPGGILISNSGGWEPSPAVAFDGTYFLVVWGDGRSGTSHIYAARVDTSGAVLDPYGLPVFLGPDEQDRPEIACDGTDCLVVWMWNGIKGLRLDKDGNVIGSEISISSTSTGYSCAIDFDGQDYMVVWTGYQDFNPYYVYGARVNTSGLLLDTSPIQISDTGPNNGEVAVSFDGTDHLAVWGAFGPVTGARVDQSGTVIDPQGIQICNLGDGLSSVSLCRGQSRGQLIAFGMCDTLGTAWSTYIHGRIRKGSTAIAFALASATSEQGHVTLSWQMAVEAVATSFRIERSESPDGEYSTLDLPISMSSGSWFSCIDYSVLPGKTYWYRIVLVGSSGEEESYGPIDVHVDAVPTAYRAYQNYPNPFNPLCTIRYDIPRGGRVNLQVFDVTGSVVRTLVDAWREPGVYSEIWDGKADDGSALPSGVYFYRLEASDFVATRKMVLLR